MNSFIIAEVSNVIVLAVIQLLKSTQIRQTDYLLTLCDWKSLAAGKKSQNAKIWYGTSKVLATLVVSICFVSITL